jgi:hypothetical protein
MHAYILYIYIYIAYNPRRGRTCPNQVRGIFQTVSNHHLDTRPYLFVTQVLDHATQTQPIPTNAHRQVTASSHGVCSVVPFSAAATNNMTQTVSAMHITQSEQSHEKTKIDVNNCFASATVGVYKLITLSPGKILCEFIRFAGHLCQC